MANASLDKNTFFRRMKRLYATWKVSIQEKYISQFFSIFFVLIGNFRVNFIFISVIFNRRRMAIQTKVLIKWIVLFLLLVRMKISSIASPQHCRYMHIICSKPSSHTATVPCVTKPSSNVEMKEKRPVLN